MKLSTVNAICGVLSAMKINKVTDKRVKTALVNDYLHLRGFVKRAEADRAELIQKFQSDWKEELASVQALRNAGKPVTGHDAYLEAERDANKAISDLFSEDVEVSLKSVPMDDFLTSCGGEELTFEQIAILQEGGIVEA